MLRFWTACLALMLTPLATVGAKELKPKFGDIGGVFYTEVSGDREACEQAIKRKIALCEQNTSFVSNTLDRKYPGCLPIFREQSRVCADHFRSEAYKCQGSGPARIGDFTGFACTVTATVVEEGEEPERAPGIAPADRWMQARTRTNVRSGPGTDHAKVGLLEAGEKVHVTGDAGAWLRIESPDGSTAFVHGSLLVSPASKDRDAAAPPLQPLGPNWSIVENQPCQVWNYGAAEKREPITWSGACVDGKASGNGRMTLSGGDAQYQGGMRDGKVHGEGIYTHVSGYRYEGGLRDGKQHGYGRVVYAGGDSYEGEWHEGKQHGRGTYIRVKPGPGNWHRYEGEFRNGKLHGRGTKTYLSGSRYEGEFRDGKTYGRGTMTYSDGYRVECPSPGMCPGPRN